MPLVDAYPKGIKNDLLDKFCRASPGFYDHTIAWRRTRKAVRLDYDSVMSTASRFMGKTPRPLFTNIEIETYNVCNGDCGFCIDNPKTDPRVHVKMSRELFYKIIDELKALGYKDKIYLFSNNEPLVDDRIIEFLKYARMQLLNAKFILYTNGKRLTPELLDVIAGLVDVLYVDCYTDKPGLSEKQSILVAYGEHYRNVHFVIRKRDEHLTSRAGFALNRWPMHNLNIPCILPFQQLIVRSNGKVSLCCNDCVGSMTMGDVSKQSLVEIWNGARFEFYRQRLLSGRRFLPLCQWCDTITTELN